MKEELKRKDDEIDKLLKRPNKCPECPILKAKIEELRQQILKCPNCVVYAKDVERLEVEIDELKRKLRAEKRAAEEILKGAKSLEGEESELVIKRLREYAESWKAKSEDLEFKLQESISKHKDIKAKLIHSGERLEERKTAYQHIEDRLRWYEEYYPEGDYNEGEEEEEDD